jgi:hypothetical protein
MGDVNGWEAESVGASAIHEHPIIELRLVFRDDEKTCEV